MSKPRPLKNRLWCLKHPDKDRQTSCKWVANEDSIKSAVEWLKQTIEEKGFKCCGDTAWHTTELLDLINKAFEDTTKK